MREMPIHGRGWLSSAHHISVYILDTNFQFIFNCANCLSPSKRKRIEMDFVVFMSNPDFDFLNPFLFN